MSSTFIRPDTPIAAELDPSQQGLKPLVVEVLEVEHLAAELDPSQQGLKPRWMTLADIEAECR